MLCVLVLWSKHDDWASKGVKVFGLVETKLPRFKIPMLPTIADGKDVMSSALTMMVIGVVESVIISREYASRNHYSVSSNRELVALGMSNIVGGFFGAYPAFGSLSRSKLNEKSKGKTQLSGIITFTVVFAFVYSFLPLLQLLPRATLSAVVIYTMVGLLPPFPKSIIFLIGVRAWNDLILLVLVFLITVFVSVESGILFAISASVVVVIKRTNLPRIKLLGRVSGSTTEFHPIHESNDELRVSHIDGMLIVCVEEPLYFANTAQIRGRLNRLELFGDMRVHPSEDRRLPPTRAIVFEFSMMHSVDGR
ncbi:hypothetical protein BB558_007508 [Smittium angustum]|uniref:STAS domain-containing protein n=1 Tax=Smittium angustum TaxID=133377 RepID=A0A2U1IUU2_SMIAN|nr:hypothetical protein BB558_007508 [Smittium angustum]